MIIAFDVHKRYTQVCIEDEQGNIVLEKRIAQKRGVFVEFLKQFAPNTPVAVETTYNWYWTVDEIEQAQMIPRLTNARLAKLMLSNSNKTDKLDARGLNKLQRTGTLPVVWIPPADVRDKRELPRTRMIIANQRTRTKNRIHSIIDKYGLNDMFEGISDMFGEKGRKKLNLAIELLPANTRWTMLELIKSLDFTESQLSAIEERMHEVYDDMSEMKLIRTLPGVGFILSAVIVSEIGDITRFPSHKHLASYSGVVPTVHSSGGKTYYGRLRKDVNRYLKWAYMEAANQVCLHRRNTRYRHAVMLYERIKKHKGHGKAIGAVARHICQSSYWVLRTGESYREPCSSLTI